MHFQALHIKVPMCLSSHPRVAQACHQLVLWRLPPQAAKACYHLQLALHSLAWECHHHQDLACQDQEGSGWGLSLLAVVLEWHHPSHR